MICIYRQWFSKFRQYSSEHLKLRENPYICLLVGDLSWKKMLLLCYEGQDVGRFNGYFFRTVNEVSLLYSEFPNVFLNGMHSCDSFP